MSGAGREGRQGGELLDRRCAAVREEELQDPGRGLPERQCCNLPERDREPCVCQHRRRRTFAQRDLGDRGGASGQFICQPERPGELRSAVLGSPPERPGAGAGRIDGDSNRLSGGAVDVASGSERVPGEPEHPIPRPGRSCATVGCVTPHRERQLCGCEPGEQAVVLHERRADAHGLERPDDAILHESGDGERSEGPRPGGGSKGRCGDATTDDGVGRDPGRCELGPERGAARCDGSRLETALLVEDAKDDGVGGERRAGSVCEHVERRSQVGSRGDAGSGLRQRRDRPESPFDRHPPADTAWIEQPLLLGH